MAAASKSSKSKTTKRTAAKAKPAKATTKAQASKATAKPGPVESGKNKGQVWNKETCIAALKAWNEEHGKVTTDAINVQAKADGSMPRSGTIRRVFGTWGAGLKAAGIKPSQTKAPAKSQAKKNEAAAA